MKNYIFIRVLVGVLLIWAGVSLGGNLIAAPAKFQVQSLSVGDLLRVGRAQFSWLGYTENAMAAMVIALRFAALHLRYFVLACVTTLAVQQLALQPMLEARSDLIIAGLPTQDSHLHIWFVVTEVIKFSLLIATAAKASVAHPQVIARERV